MRMYGSTTQLSIASLTNESEDSKPGRTPKRQKLDQDTVMFWVGR